MNAIKVIFMWSGQCHQLMSPIILYNLCTVYYELILVT